MSGSAGTISAVVFDGVRSRMDRCLYLWHRKVKEALAKSGFVSEMWRYEILDFADDFADAGGDVRVYLWKVPSTRDNMYKSAVHAVELAYVFNNRKEDIYAERWIPGPPPKYRSRG